MNDSMYEQIVARRTPPYLLPLKIGSVVVLIILFLILSPILSVFAIVPPLIAGVLLYYFVFPKMRVEFEYTVINHDMQIDAIYSREKRKKMIELDLRQIEWIAPTSAESYKRVQNATVMDFTTKSADERNVFGILLAAEGGSRLIRFEPDEHLLNHIRQRTGSKFLSR